MPLTAQAYNGSDRTGFTSNPHPVLVFFRKYIAACRGQEELAGHSATQIFYGENCRLHVPCGISYTSEVEPEDMFDMHFHHLEELCGRKDLEIETFILVSDEEKGVYQIHMEAGLRVYGSNSCEGPVCGDDGEDQECEEAADNGEEGRSESEPDRSLEDCTPMVLVFVIGWAGHGNNGVDGLHFLQVRTYFDEVRMDGAMNWSSYHSRASCTPARQ